MAILIFVKKISEKSGKQIPEKFSFLGPVNIVGRHITVGRYYRNRFVLQAGTRGRSTEEVRRKYGSQAEGTYIGVIDGMGKKYERSMKEV